MTNCVDTINKFLSAEKYKDVRDVKWFGIICGMPFFDQDEFVLRFKLWLNEEKEG